MRLLVFLILLFPLVGCAKKDGKPTDSTNGTPSPSVAKAPPSGDKPKPTEKEKGTKGEKPNWLTDPRFKKDKDDVPEDNPTGKPGWGAVKPPVGGWADSPLPPAVGAPVAPMGLPQPGAGPPATGSPSKTSGKAVTKADMNEVWIFIENRSGATGQMPAPETTYAALVEAKATAAELVKDGSIILTGAKTRESIWAFEKNAPTQGGWVATQNGPEQLSAAQFAQRIGR